VQLAMGIGLQKGNSSNSTGGLYPGGKMHMSCIVYFMGEKGNLNLNIFERLLSRRYISHLCRVIFLEEMQYGHAGDFGAGLRL